MTKSALQIARAAYQPKVPAALKGAVKAVDGEYTQSVADQDEIKKLFPNTYGMPVVTFEKSNEKKEGEFPMTLKNEKRNMIFAGLVIGVIASLLVLAFRFGLAREARLYLLGAAALVGIQTLVHISVNLCLLPTTGLTLPLISYGGSSLIMLLAQMGLVLSISRTANIERQ